MEGKDAKGRFTRGHKISVGKRNKPKAKAAAGFVSTLPQSEVRDFYQQCWNEARGIDSDGNPIEVDKDLKMFFLGRLVAPLRAVAKPVVINAADTSDPVQLVNTAMDMMARGEISAEQAQQMTAAIESMQATKAIVELGPTVLEGERALERLQSGRR